MLPSVSPPIRIRFVEDVAAPSISKEGNPILQGRKTFRLALEVEGTPDSRFYISAQKVGHFPKTFFSWCLFEIRAFFRRFSHVDLTIGDEVFALSLRSLSHRLHLSIPKIQQLAKQGNLLTALQTTQADRIAKSLNLYAASQALYRREGEELVQSKLHASQSEPIKISAPLLMKVIKQALKLKPDEGKTYEVQNQEFILKRLPDGINQAATHSGYPAIRVIRTTANVLSSEKGQFGSISEVDDMLEVKKRAFKVPKVFTDPLHKKVLLSEYEILKSLNQSKDGKPAKIPGIQRVVDLIGFDEYKVGILEKLYEQDYDTILQNQKLTLKTRILVIYQILYALCYAKQKRILHGDIKPENIFVKRTDVHLADWGLARNLDKGIQEFENFSGSSEYSTEEDFEQDTALKNNFRITDVKNLSLARDVFAAGTTIYQILTQQFDEYPYPLTEVKVSDKITANFQDTRLPLRKDFDRSLKDTPKSLQILLKNMLHRNWRDRFEVEKVFSQFLQAVQNFSSNTYANLLKEFPLADSNGAILNKIEVSLPPDHIRPPSPTKQDQSSVTH